jgi:hypothetical protein
MTNYRFVFWFKILNIYILLGFHLLHRMFDVQIHYTLNDTVLKYKLVRSLSSDIQHVSHLLILNRIMVVMLIRFV